MMVFLFILVSIFGNNSICRAEVVRIGFVTAGNAVNDNSFNGMTIAGLRRLQRDFQVEVLVRSGGYVVESVRQAILSLLKENVRIIVTNSATVEGRFAEIALDYPNVVFVLNDCNIEGYPNVVSIDYAQEMGSYLVGALCAWQTKTGKVGFIGGNEMPVIKGFLNGFLQGVRFSGRDIEVDVKFVRRGNSEKGFEDPKQANALAMGMYNSGVDIIYAVAGLAGNGVIQAARKTGNQVVGVDSNQDHMAKGVVLTSMMKRLDVAVYKEVRSILTGTFAPGCKVYNLGNEGVGLTEMKYSKHLVAPEVLDKLEKLRNDLISGNVKVEPSAE